MMLLALPIFLLSLLTYSKDSYAAIPCQDSATKTDIFFKQCPKLFSGERTYCYHVIMVNTTKGTKSKTANCSGYAVDLDKANKSKNSASDHKPSETYQLNRILAVFRNGTSGVNGTNGSNWIWIDRLHWDCNCAVENTTEKNCSNVLTTSKIYQCGTLPCGKNCSFFCKGFCKAHNFDSPSRKGNYKLDEIRQDDKISRKCHYGPSNATMEATCLDPSNSDTVKQWNISDKHCLSFYDVLLSQLTENVSTILNVTQSIEDQIDAKELNSFDIGSVSEILYKIANFSEAQIPKNKEISERFYRIVNDVLKVNKTIISTSNKNTNSSNRYINAVETFAKKHDFPKQPGKSRTIANLTNLIVILSTANKSRLNFSGDAKDTVVYGTEHSNKNGLEVFNIELSIPTQAFDMANSSNVVFVLYRKTSFFKLTEEDITVKIRGYVIAASLVTSNKITGLTDPVVIRYPNVPKSREVDVRRALCVFWNFINKPKLDGWSTGGCNLVQTYDNSGYDNCHCDHLTSFAMLLDVLPETVPNKHKEILSLISYIGCSLSFLGILLILLTMFIFKELLASISSKIFLNICISLGAALAVFLAAAERRDTFSDVQCIAAGMLNHFLFLVAFAWMVLEAYTMFFAFVKLLPKELFEAKIPRIWVSCLICWGIPGVIVGITASMTLGSYENDKHCLLQGFPAMLAFLIPVALCVSVNTISFLFILRSLLKSGSTITSTKKTSGVEQARRGAAISVYLGLTWMSGLLAVGDAKLLFQYLFCIFNSLQGFMIFLFYCVFSAEVRAKYRARFFNSPSKRSKLPAQALTQFTSESTLGGGMLEIQKIAATLNGGPSDLDLSGRMRSIRDNNVYEKCQ